MYTEISQMLTKLAWGFYTSKKDFNTQTESLLAICKVKESKRLRR